MVSSLAACGQKNTDGVSGEFSGAAKGMGNIKVTITLQDSVITYVKVEGENETEGIGTKAIEQLPGDMVKANFFKVDGVAGYNKHAKHSVSCVFLYMECGIKKRCFFTILSQFSCRKS